MTTHATSQITPGQPQPATARSMLRPQSQVFANNYRMHLIVLLVSQTAHFVVAATVPEARVMYLGVASLNIPLLVGRWYLHYHVDRKTAQQAGSTAWCLTVMAIYLVASMDTAGGIFVAQQAASNAVLGLIVYSLSAVAGMLHASVAPPLEHSLAVLASLTVATVCTCGPNPNFYAYGLTLWIMHVAGYGFCKHLFTQQATIVRVVSHTEALTEHIGIVGEMHDNSKERLQYELMFAKRRARNSDRALEEIRTRLKLFEKELTTRSSPPRPHPSPNVEPLFSRAVHAAATDDTLSEMRTADADTFDGDATAIPNLDALRSDLEANARALESERVPLTPKVAHMIKRLEEATEPLDLTNSLKSSDDDKPIKTLDQFMKDEHAKHVDRQRTTHRLRGRTGNARRAVLLPRAQQLKTGRSHAPGPA